MGRARRVARYVFSFGRVALAVALLAGLWLGTVQGVQRASRDADQRRGADHLAVAQGFAGSVRDWLDAGRSDATSLSHKVGVLVPQAVTQAIDTFLFQPHTFARGAIVFSG